MRERFILNVVNVLQTQARLILHLECRHNVSLWLIDQPQLADRIPQRGDTCMCQDCPDPPPPTSAEIRQAKSAKRLWKEAGEP